MSRQSILLWALILVACHCRQGAQALGPDSTNSQQAAASEPSSIDGLSFIVESRPQDHQKSPSNGLTTTTTTTTTNNNNNNNIIKQQQIDNDLESIFRPDNPKRSALRVDLMDSAGKHPMNQRDLWRMTRLDQVLEELSSSIPPAKQQLQQQAPASPLYRSSRTYPSSAAPYLSGANLIDQSIGRAGLQVNPMMTAVAAASSAASNDLFGGRMLAFPIKSDQLDQWQQQQQQQQLNLGGTLSPSSSSSSLSANGLALQQQLLDAGLVTRPVSVPIKGRKPAAGLMGILWSPTRPNGGGVSGGGVSNGVGPTPYYSAPGPQSQSQQQQQQQQQQSQLHSGSVSGTKKSQPPSQQSRLLSPGSSLSGQSSALLGPLAAGSSASSPHHRSGTEEFALHTPIHSQSASDYEWKRVENSRWNNLRGMWGKRAINERYNDLNNFKEMLESEARDLIRTTAAANNGFTGYGSQSMADVDNLIRSLQSPSSSSSLQQRQQRQQPGLIVPM